MGMSEKVMHFHISPLTKGLYYKYLHSFLINYNKSMNHPPPNLITERTEIQVS